MIRSANDDSRREIQHFEKTSCWLLIRIFVKSYMPLIQLIYVSTASKEMGVNDLATILNTSAQHNQKTEITGMLLYGQGRFIQVLEGSATDVDELMSRIKVDPRHHYVNVIDRHVIRSRDFSNWSMGFHLVSESEISSNPSYVDFFNASFDSSKSNIKLGVPLIMLKAFANNLPI